MVIKLVGQSTCRRLSQRGVDSKADSDVAGIDSGIVGESVISFDIAEEVAI